jgi:hypothetical protein
MNTRYYVTHIPGGGRGYIQGAFEMRAEILTTSYWLHEELGKNI